MVAFVVVIVVAVEWGTRGIFFASWLLFPLLSSMRYVTNQFDVILSHWFPISSGVIHAILMVVSEEKNSYHSYVDWSVFRLGWVVASALERGRCTTSDAPSVERRKRLAENARSNPG